VYDYNPLVGDTDPGTGAPLPPWRQTLQHRMGEGKGQFEEKGKGKKGKPSGKKGGWAPSMGYWAAGSAWGAKGGNAARTEAPGVDDEDGWFFTLFCIMMVLIGVGLASRAFRRPLARVLHMIAHLLDDGAVRAFVSSGTSVGTNPALSPNSAGGLSLAHGGAPRISVGSQAVQAPSARAMPSRTELIADNIAFKRQRSQRDDAASVPATSDQTTQIGMVSWGRVRDHVDKSDKGTQCGAAPIVLQSMTCYELKAMAKAHGLMTSGVKADLVGRISGHLASQSDPMRSRC
jgi:hypothetical protein